MVNYKYDLPTASPLDDYPQWVGLVWAAINTHLDHPYAWSEEDAEQAQKYIDDLYSAIQLPPPSSGGGIVRLLSEGERATPIGAWEVTVPAASGVKQFRLVVTAQHEDTGERNIRVRFSDPTGSWFRQQTTRIYLVQWLNNKLSSNLDIMSVLPSIVDNSNESGVAVIDIYNPENDDRYKQFFVQATFKSRHVEIGGVWEQTQPITHLKLYTTGGDYSIGSTYRLYGFY